MIRKYGGAGYLVFFGVIEIYAREFKTEDGWKLDISLDYLRRKFWLSQYKVLKNILKTIAAEGKWEVEYKEDRVIITVLKFRSYLDESTLKKLREKEAAFRKRSGMIPKTEPTEVEVDKEVDKDKRKKEKERKKFLSNSFNSFWKTYPGTKTAKKKCLEKWLLVNPDQKLFDKIMGAIREQILWRKTAKPNEFRAPWKNPHTWLNQECWNDETGHYVKPAARYKDYKCNGCGRWFKLDIDKNENQCPHCHVIICKKMPGLGPVKPDSKVESFIAGVAGSMGGKT